MKSLLLVNFFRLITIILGIISIAILIRAVNKGFVSLPTRGWIIGALAAGIATALLELRTGSRPMPIRLLGISCIVTCLLLAYDPLALYVMVDKSLLLVMIYLVPALSVAAVLFFSVDAYLATEYKKHHQKKTTQ